ncbi:MAG: PHP domain-containing protein [Candidatus Hodarchaeales archaeon]|jgi:histidinol phosphatase-like PHP family hydrolase
MSLITEIRDYHIHSNFSDGYLTPEQISQIAIDRKVREICITDHYSKFKPALQTQELETYYYTLQELQKHFKNKIKIFIGIEVDLSSKADFFELQQFDWDLVLFEYTFNLPAWEELFKEVINFKNQVSEVNVGLAHTRFSRVSQKRFEFVIKSLQERKIIIELNSHYRNYMDPWFQYLDDQFLYSIGSDAHSEVQIGDIQEPIRFLKNHNIPMNRIIQL